MATKFKEAGTITVTKLHPVIGAEVSGVDLSQELDPATVEAIRRAWYDHTVLVFRGQDISGDDQLRLWWIWAGLWAAVAAIAVIALGPALYQQKPRVMMG